MTLGPSGPLPPEAAGELLDLLLSAFPPKTKGTGKRFVPAEFVGELEEQVLEDIATIAADNPRREAEIAANPPTPDAQAAAVAREAERVRSVVRECFKGMRLLKPKVRRRP